MKHIIHVNQHIIKKNRKTGSKEPVITIKNYKSNSYTKKVRINGSCTIIYSPDQPLSCGATVWIEIEGEVEFE